MDAQHKHYERGVANKTDHPKLVNREANLAEGNTEALAREKRGLQAVADFYQNPQNRATPLDVVGYSRGAVEAVKLINDLIGTPAKDKNTKVTQHGAGGPVNQYKALNIHVRFVGLISPVMGPFAEDKTQKGILPVVWTYDLPGGVDWLYQALDKDEDDAKKLFGNPVLTQHVVTRAQGTKGDDHTYKEGHIKVGHDPQVLTDMTNEAKAAGAPAA